MFIRERQSLAHDGLTFLDDLVGNTYRLMGIIIPGVVCTGSGYPETLSEALSDTYIFVGCNEWDSRYN